MVGQASNSEDKSSIPSASSITSENVDNATPTLTPAPIPRSSPWKTSTAVKALEPSSQPAALRLGSQDLKRRESKGAQSVIRPTQNTKWVPIQAAITVAPAEGQHESKNRRTRGKGNKPSRKRAPRGGASQNPDSKDSESTQRAKPSTGSENGQHQGAIALQLSDAKQETQAVESREIQHKTSIKKDDSTPVSLISQESHKTHSRNKSLNGNHTNNNILNNNGNHNPNNEFYRRRSPNTRPKNNQYHTDTRRYSQPDPSAFQQRSRYNSYRDGNQSQGYYQRGGSNHYNSGWNMYNNPVAINSTNYAYPINYMSNYPSYSMMPTTQYGALPEYQIPSFYRSFYPIQSVLLAVNNVAKQLEYYMSKENLVKDQYLRSKFDKDGYVPLSLVAKFYRITNMSFGGDPFIILAALREILAQEESTIDVAVGKLISDNSKDKKTTKEREVDGNDDSVDSMLDRYFIRAKNYAPWLPESFETLTEIEEILSQEALDEFRISVIPNQSVGYGNGLYDNNNYINRGDDDEDLHGHGSLDK